MAIVDILTPHARRRVRLTQLRYELGVQCCAEKIDGDRCTYRSSYVTSSGFPVCKHHTEPWSSCKVWPA